MEFEVKEDNAEELMERDQEEEGHQAQQLHEAQREHLSDSDDCQCNQSSAAVLIRWGEITARTRRTDWFLKKVI